MSIFLRKDQAGGVGPYLWEHNGDVIEVDDETGLALLKISHAGFSVAEQPSEEVQEKIEALSDESESKPDVPLNFDEDDSGQSNLAQALAATDPPTSGRSRARRS